MTPALPALRDRRSRFTFNDSFPSLFLRSLRSLSRASPLVMRHQRSREAGFTFGDATPEVKRVTEGEARERPSVSLCEGLRVMAQEEVFFSRQRRGREIENERRLKEAQSASHWQKSNGNGSHDLNRYKKWKRGVEIRFLFHSTIQNQSLQPISTLSKLKSPSMKIFDNTFLSRAVEGSIVRACYIRKMGYNIV